nr:DNA-binding domain-containing protein [uncultured Rhodopila sp.]
MPALPELQRSFVDAIVSGDPSGLADAVIGNGFTPAQRIQVYRNNTFITLTEALAATYPAIVRLVDRSFFDFAAAQFIPGNLPDRPCLFEYGGGFADFLAGFAPLADYPFLPGVARLEWAVNTAWNAPARTPLAFDALARAATTAGETLRLSLDALYLASDWNVDDIWQANRAGADGETLPISQPVRLQIRRGGPGVIVERLDPATWSLRQHLAHGETLGAAAAAAFAETPDFDLGAALRALAAESLPDAIIPPPQPKEPTP